MIRDGDVERENMFVGEAGVARLVSHPVFEIAGVQSSDDDGAVFAVLVEDPVVVRQRVRRADLCPLLSRGGGEGADPTLSLDVDRSLVEVARQAHVPVHADERLVGEVGHRLLVDDVAVLVQNPDELAVLVVHGQSPPAAERRRPRRSATRRYIRRSSRSAE
jgi:hypothetical protein